MADDINKPSTHYSSLEANIEMRTSEPSEPEEGQTYYDTANNRLGIYNGGYWRYKSFSTTTSTSTSTTTTSTSTSTTSTSTSTTSTSSSTSTSLTTSTSTSTTTTL